MSEEPASGLSRRRPGDWMLAAEALACLAAASLALRATRFEALAGWASAAPVGGRHDARLALRISAAVRAAAARAAWPCACFSQALACHLMLRRRRLPSRLYYGARNQGSSGPIAHVWVRSGALALIGAETAAQFALLATFPPLEAPDGGLDGG